LENIKTKKKEGAGLARFFRLRDWVNVSLVTLDLIADP